MSLITDPNAGQGGTSGSGGNQVPDWRSSLPEELRGEKVFESIKGKDWNEAGPVLAKNYVNAQRLVGADKVVLPTDKSSPEEIAAFRSKLGVPAKPEEYTFKLPEGMAETSLDKNRIDTWRKELHEAGIPKAAAERIMSKYIAEEHSARTGLAQAKQNEIQQHELALKQELGTKFDEKINFARYAVKEFGSEALVDMLDKTGLGSHPEVVKLFATIGEKLGDDKARGTGGIRFDNQSKEGAQAALNEFNRNAEKTKALFDREHPQHDAVVKERAALFAAAFPSEKK
jgi:hypothetical protein